MKNKIVYKYFAYKPSDVLETKLKIKDFFKITSDKKIILFGAGEICKEFLKNNKKKCEVISIVDNNVCGAQICGINIENADNLKKYNTEEYVMLVVTSQSRHEICKQLNYNKIGEYYCWIDILYNTEKNRIKLYIGIKKVIVKIKEIIRNMNLIVYNFFEKIFNKFCELLPYNAKQILFMNTQSDKGFFACNPKYLTLEMLKMKAPLKIVWLSNCNKNMFPKGIKVVKNTKLNRMFYLSTSKVWVDNNGSLNDQTVNKKKGQYYINTWHASITLKNCGFSTKNCNAHIKSLYRNSSNMTDLYITSGKEGARFCRKALGYCGEIFESGDARNDILIKNDCDIINEIKKKLRIDKKYKILIYAPTFRQYLDNTMVPPKKLDFDKVKKCLEKKFGGKWMILLRIHPFAKGDYTVSSDYVKDVTNYPDIQELLLISDSLISDYSSNIFDFCITGKPAFIFASDIEEYIKYDRGFWVDFWNLPFPISTNDDEIEKSIMNFNLAKYEKELDEMYEKYGFIRDGKSSNRICKKILKYFNI